ncbi:superfamily II DNA and RNA helicase [Candidatus Aquiluna sp. IMCC13023]|uniref:DEAD/DEAH box helicase n=1 Tax=Candidatus Aquiluna sp. IMCC13023 TaxID=1081644 RepID=UPI00025B2B7B|nr:DEAD/DEAH box helicase [Candidatus Aquiluna sp. IMCC13023]EIC91555.1 superfamily II DNA and RNA helicase [Candidatus Aquiluna sp. IMCC13023]
MSSKTFIDLGVPAEIAAVLSAQGIDTPFPIQVDSLPDTLAGRDVLGRGKTGSGKTLAFGIPMVARLAVSSNSNHGMLKPRGLVLAPTRELATQITNALQPLANAMDLRVTTIFGGVPQKKQVQALRDGVEIIVATPGRLEDLMAQGILKLDAIEITVLDEADHMADLGFLPGVTRILNATPRGGQRLLFSATLDNGVKKLVDKFLQNQVMHAVDEANSPVTQMTHHVLEASDAEAKKRLVYALASGTGRRILFMRTKHHAKKLAKALTQAGIPAVDLHGNLSQAARDRNLEAFSSGRAKVLVATDVAARGVHVDGVDLVIHVDPPAEHKAYLHRSGRTARAGASGDVVTISLPTQRKDLSDLLSKAKISVKPRSVTEKSPEVIALIGEVAEYVKPTAPVVQPKKTGTSTGRNAQRKRALSESGKPQNQQSRAPGSRPHSQGATNGSRRRQNSR